MKHPYSYVILRYVHDIMTGEQLNVGVVVFSPEGRYLGASCRPTYLRLSNAFPGLRGESFKSMSRFVQSQIERIGESLHNDSLVCQKDLSAIVTGVLPKDESSFQWSEPGFGVSGDLPKTLDDLYERLVTRYDERAQPERRTDEDVWRFYKRDLEKRRVLKYLKPKRIITPDDEVEFRHAWKNGSWHCLEPVSFDLSRSDSIRDKAHKILGELTSVSTASESFKVYLLVGRPRTESVMETYDKALRNLDKAGTNVEIVTEEQASAFIERFASEIEAHEQIQPSAS